MRIAVTGKNGQVARSLFERAAGSEIEICAIARPDFNLLHPASIQAALKVLRPAAIINAAAYTAVDLAESEPVAARIINADGAKAVARAAARLGIPIIHLSTDYVFDGKIDRPYREDDRTSPLGVYGASKLEGEQEVASANNNHAILRTAWVYSPFGKNFARTILSLATGRDELSVVSDQLGTPTNALDIADGVLAIAKNLITRPNEGRLRGVFHMTCGGETNWAEFARSIFAISAAVGGPSARVNPIPSSAYPTAARRPANSRLDNTHLLNAHDVRLPHWQHSLPACIKRLVAQDFQKKD